VPTLPSEDHVIIAVCTIGLCGSDVCVHSLFCSRS
jgi:threonine dehydrogenase-like Zn-dependent dehydrogenase